MPMRSSRTLKIMIVCFLTLVSLKAYPSDWRELQPLPAQSGTRTVLFSLNGTDIPLGSEDASNAFQAAGSTRVPTQGFLDRVFTRQAHSGKLGRVVDALGLQSIYNQPLIRNLLDRVRGSRFCLSGGCGVNLKLSLRKPGLRFEHPF